MSTRASKNDCLPGASAERDRLVTVRTPDGTFVIGTRPKIVQRDLATAVRRPIYPGRKKVPETPSLNVTGDYDTAPAGHKTCIMDVLTRKK